MAISERSFNLANWEEHPNDNRYFVFRFNKSIQAQRFKVLLEQEHIEFQFHKEGDVRLFAIERNDFDAARKLNYLVMAENREPMISNAFLRWSFVIVILVAVTISIIGHCNKQAKDQEGIHRSPLEKHESAV